MKENQNSFRFELSPEFCTKIGQKQIGLKDIWNLYKYIITQNTPINNFHFMYQEIELCQYFENKQN